MPHHPKPLKPDRKGELSKKIFQTLESYVSKIPPSEEHETKDPHKRARALINKAAAKAALTSGGLALPAGPVGLLTIGPDLLVIWKLQAQMVADLAGAFGKSSVLTREQMIYCLFKHVAAQAVRDLIVRVGERFLIRHLPLRAIQKIMEKIAVKVSHRVISKAIARWLPIAGAVGVGAYAYYDTAQVGKTALELFSKEIEIEAEGGTAL